MKTCPQCHKTYDDLFEICPNDDTSLVAFTGNLAADPLVGNLFAGRFQIVAKIGQGGMGAIYKAIHNRMDRTCAIKLLTALSSDNEAALVRFNREAKMASRIDHPHAVTIYDFGESESGIAYLAMEFVDGRPLSHIMVKEKILPLDRVVHITNQIAEALDAAHRIGIVHRDLKPDNVMITRKVDDPEYVKVLDFGIAKAVTEQEQDNLTKTGYVLGTPLYMSPEQLSGDKLDGRSDVYSLAIIAYEMLCGQLPFDGDNTQAMMIKRVTGEPIPLSVRTPEVSPEVESAVMRGLMRDRDHRFSTALEFASALASARRITAPQESKSTNALGQSGQGRATVEYSSNPGQSTIEHTEESSPGTMAYSSIEVPDAAAGPSGTVISGSLPTPPDKIETPNRQPEVTYPQAAGRPTRASGREDYPPEAPTEAAIPKFQVKSEDQPAVKEGSTVIKSDEKKVRHIPVWVWPSGGATLAGVMALIYFLIIVGKPGFTIIIKGAPPGSEVQVNSVKRGVTGPDGTLTLTDIGEGNAGVRIARDGYADFDASVTGVKGEERTVEARLLPLEIDFQGEMVLIPAGEFPMGDDNGYDDAKPVHTVNLKAFYIDRYEVSNGQYAKFCEDEGRKPPTSPGWDPNYFTAHPESPLMGITRDEAIAYAKWAGKRLPTEEEWEKAASWDPAAKKKRLWPWGDEPNIENLNIASDRPSSVRHQTRDRSAYGVFGMAGNVWEWVSGYYDPYPGNTKSEPEFGQNKTLIRGGCFLKIIKIDEARTTYRNFLPDFPPGMSTPIGVRCAISADHPGLQEFLSKSRK